MIDGGNTFYQDDVRRAAGLAKRGIHHLDVGTSGGVWGLERGYCLMIGGKREQSPSGSNRSSRRSRPATTACRAHPAAKVATPAPSAAISIAGRSGAGHFVKMIHNGIEYGLMQAYAEGFDILRNAAKASIPAERRYQFDTRRDRRGLAARQRGVVVAARPHGRGPRRKRELSNYSGVVEDSGEGRWTVNAAVEEAVPADVLTAALYTRFRSRQDHTFAEKILSAMRHKFGGHVEPPKKS